MHRTFQQSYHVPGALSGNVVIRFKMPCNATLIHVSAVQSDTNQGTVKVGDSSDNDEYLTASALGLSGTPAEYDGNDFVDTSGNTHTRYYPRIAKGTIVLVTITDGSGHAHDPTVVLTFAEG
jgi:hypothetical protein